MLLFLILMLFSGFIVSSDSGILYYDHHVGVYRYGGIPYQDAMIFYSDGYELLIVISHYHVETSNSTTLYYFPLPSKPLLYGAFRTIKPFTIKIRSIALKSIGSISRYPDSNPLAAILVFSPIIANVGGLGRSPMLEIGRIEGEEIDLRIVEASRPTIDDVKAFLSMNGMSINIPDSFSEILDHYNGLGWEYVVLGKTVLSNESILVTYYLFKTDKIVYPLYVDKLAPGQTRISLTIVSENPLSPRDLGVEESYDINIVLKTILKNAYVEFLGDLKDSIRFHKLIANASEYISSIISYGKGSIKCHGLLYTLEYGSMPTARLVSDFIAYPYEDEYTVLYSLKDYSLKPSLDFRESKYSIMPVPNVFTISLTIVLIYLLTSIMKGKWGSRTATDLLIVILVAYIPVLLIGLHYLQINTIFTAYAYYMPLTSTYILLYNLSILLIPLFIGVSVYYLAYHEIYRISKTLIWLLVVLWGLMFLTQIVLTIDHIVLLTIFVIESIILLKTSITTTYKSSAIAYSTLFIQAIIITITSIPLTVYLLETIGSLYIAHIIAIITIIAITIVPQLYGLFKK